MDGEIIKENFNFSQRVFILFMKMAKHFLLPGYENSEICCSLYFLHF